MPTEANNVTELDSAKTSDAHLLIQGLSDALTDGMVERLVTTMGNGLELLDKFNDEDTRDALDSLIDQLTMLHRSGGLVSLFETIHMINAMRNAMTDGMVERLAIFIEHMIANMANEEIAELAGQTHESLIEAREEIASAPSSGGLMSSLRILSQPETQNALRFMVSVSKKLQENVD